VNREIHKPPQNRRKYFIFNYLRKNNCLFPFKKTGPQEVFGSVKHFSKEVAWHGIFGIVSAYQALNKTFGGNEKLTLFGEVAYLSAPLMGKIY
jgi:hypothetical protein